MVKGTIEVGGEVSSVGRNIGVTSANSIVDPSSRVGVDIQLRIVGVGQVSAMEVCFNVAILVRGAREVVRESSR